MRGGLLAAALALLSCTTVPAAGPPRERARPARPALTHAPLRADAFVVQPEGITVEESWILDLYTLLHRRSLRAFRVVFPGHGSEQATAHLLLPAGEGPHPLVVVFPILAGSHVVSEALTKALVERGFAVARLERPGLDLDTAREPELPARVFGDTVRDARRLLDFLLERPDLDPTRVHAAGVSLGGMLACILTGADARVQRAFLVMAGGGLPEMLHDSAEKPVRAFRDRLIAERGLADREAFLAFMRPYVESVEPLRFARAIESGSVMLISGRFDRVMPPARTEALWEALGHPTWRRFPAGHYQLFPFFWWAIARGVEHLQALP